MSANNLFGLCGFCKQFFQDFSSAPPHQKNNGPSLITMLFYTQLPINWLSHLTWFYVACNIGTLTPIIEENPHLPWFSATFVWCYCSRSLQKHSPFSSRCRCCSGDRFGFACGSISSVGDGSYVKSTMQIDWWCRCLQWVLCMITSLARNSRPSHVCTKLFSSSGTLHVDILFILAALGFCSW